MEHFWRTKKFKVLSIEWDTNLKVSGFRDIETSCGGEKVLKQRATNAYRQADEFERASKLEYFCTLSHLAQRTLFPSPLEQIIMQSHAEGVAIKEIVDELQKMGLSRDRRTIRFIIRRWQMKWGIRTWSPCQMNLKAIK